MLSLLAVLISGLAPALATETVDVIVNKIGPSRGRIVGIICSEEEFKSLDCRRSALSGPPVDGRATLRFTVPEGRYAVSIFHDLYGDRRLRRSFLGIPREGVGFSRNPRLLGKPKFSDAAIRVPRGGTSLAIDLQFEPRG